MTAYEPITGLFDDNAASFSVGNFLEDVSTVGFTFNPDTTTVRAAFGIGGSFSASITPEIPNYEISVYVPEAADVNFGCRSSANLSFILRDPAGTQVVNNLGQSACLNDRSRTLVAAGTYIIKVGRGAAGQYGDFTVGLDYTPFPATRYLCGELAGVLFKNSSPYLLFDACTIASSDMLSVEAGTIIEVNVGGRITSLGQMLGLGSEAEPIRLVPFSGSPVYSYSR